MIPLGVLASAHVPAAGGGASGAFITSVVDSTDASSYTFSGLSFGAPAADRRIHVVVVFRNYSAITAFTIGGVSATQDVLTTYGNTGVTIYSAAVPSGSTGTVAITLTGAALRCHVYVYATTGMSATPTGTSTATNSVSATLTPDSAAGGFVIAAAATSATTIGCVWTGDADQDSSLRVEMGSDTASGETTASTSITATWQAAVNHTAYAAVAYAPA